MSGKMVGKSMVFYFKYGRQLEQYCELKKCDQKNAIKIGAPDLNEEQRDEKMAMIDDVVTKATAQAKEFFGELADRASDILAPFCSTSVIKMPRIDSDWESFVYIFPRTIKNKKVRKLGIWFMLEIEGQDVKNSGYFQLEMIFFIEDSNDKNEERLLQVIKNIYKGKIATICNWKDWDKDNNFGVSLIRIPVYREGIHDFQVEIEQLFNDLLAPLKMLKQKDIDKILEVMY